MCDSHGSRVQTIQKAPQAIDADAARRPRPIPRGAAAGT